MDFSFFENQIGRLKRRHGEKAYPHEFQDILWTSFRNVNQNSFLWVVDQVIAEHRFEPPLSKFKEYSQAHQRRDDFKNPVYIPKASVADPQAVKDMIHNLNLRMTGKMSKEHFSEYVKWLKEDFKKTNVDKFKCVQCEDRGEYYAFDGENGNCRLHFCTCRGSM